MSNFHFRYFSVFSVFFRFFWCFAMFSYVHTTLLWSLVTNGQNPCVLEAIDFSAFFGIFRYFCRYFSVFSVSRWSNMFSYVCTTTPPSLVSIGQDPCVLELIGTFWWPGGRVGGWGNYGFLSPPLEPPLSLGTPFRNIHMTGINNNRYTHAKWGQKKYA